MRKVLIALLVVGLARAAQAAPCWCYVTIARAGQSPSKRYVRPEHKQGLPQLDCGTMDPKKFPLKQHRPGEGFRRQIEEYILAHFSHPDYKGYAGLVDVKWCQRMPDEMAFPPDAFAAGCKKDNSSCKDDEECCSKFCDNGCKPNPGVPTTTQPLPPGVTVTTSSTTSTTRPEFNQAHPRRFGPADIGLAYYASSDDVMYDPADGSWASQYVKQQRIEYAWFVMLPKVVDLMIEIGVQPPDPGTVQDNMGKFIFGYGCRYIECEKPGQGGQYVWRANYLVDRWRVVMKAVAGKVLKGTIMSTITGNPWTSVGEQAAAKRPWLAPLMGINVKATPRQTKLDKSHENDGELNGSRKFQPLNVEQCAALAAATHAHDVGANIDTTQLAFEATARNVYELALFAHQFPTGVYPDKSPARVADLDRKKHAAYHEWSDSFGCATHVAPTTGGVVQKRWKHVRNHVLRAMPEGYKLRELCGRYIDSCDITSE